MTPPRRARKSAALTEAAADVLGNAVTAEELLPPAPRVPFGTLNERQLHAALKAHYHVAGDLIEAKLAGCEIDLLRGELIIEIQTGNFTRLRRKLQALLPRLDAGHRVRIVLPIALHKWIVRLGEQGERISRRKSPLRGRPETACADLVYLGALLREPRIEVELALIHEEELRRKTGARRWRTQGWGTHERRLLEFVEARRLQMPGGLLTLLPAGLPERFTSADIAALGGIKPELARQMLYCLRVAGLVDTDGKAGRAVAHRLVTGG